MNPQPADGYRVPRLRPAELDPDQRSLYDEIAAGPSRMDGLVRDDGSLAGPFDAMLRSPSIGLHLQRVGAAIRFSGDLPPDIREVAILLTAHRWKSDFEWNIHEQVAVRAGVPLSQLRALRNGEVDALSDPRYRLVEEVANTVLAGDRVPASTFRALTDSLGPSGAFELLSVIGYYTTLAFVLNAFGIDSA